MWWGVADPVGAFPSPLGSKNFNRAVREEARAETVKNGVCRQDPIDVRLRSRRMECSWRRDGQMSS